MPLESTRINWFRRAVTRLRGNRRNSIVQKLQCERTEQSGPNCCRELPPELWDKILSLINEESTLFTCRLVNWQWNHIARDLLEDLHLQKWIGWEPISPFPSCEPPLAPKLVQNHTKHNNHGFSHLRLPPALERYKELEGNPFPTKSLKIYYNLVFSLKQLHNSSAKWDKLFINFGSCLNSIILHNLQISLSQLSLMLSQTPNLKALTLRYMMVRGIPTIERLSSSVVEEMNKVTISPHLQTLQLLGHNNKNIPNWLLDNLEQRLLNLKIELGSNSLGLLSSSRNFENLKQLKITATRPHPPDRKIWEPETPPKNLQFISVFITSHSEDVESYHVPQKRDVVKFLCQFSSSLVQLRVNMEFKYFLKNLRKRQTVFPNLERLSVSARECNNGDMVENWKELLLEKNASNLLPNLQSVQVLHNLF